MTPGSFRPVAFDNEGHEIDIGKISKPRLLKQLEQSTVDISESIDFRKDISLLDNNVKLVDANSLLKSEEVIINVNNEFIKRATWVPIEEVTSYDLFKIGFNNYDMPFSVAEKIYAVLEHTEVKTYEDET